jgi:methylmalonyl-CoA/ethylmalonyl-CoA epimerase
VTKIHHIGIAVQNIDRLVQFYTKLCNAREVHIEEVKSDGVKIAFIEIGESKIELLEPLDPSSPVHKFLERHGEGMHHIAIEVEDINAQLETLKKMGVQLIDEIPRQGSEGLLIAFIHPKSTGGVLIELCERRS